MLLSLSRFRHYNAAPDQPPKASKSAPADTVRGAFVYRDVIQFAGNSMTSYNRRPTRNEAYTDDAKKYNTENLTPGLSETNGFISPATYRRLKKISENWYFAHMAHRQKFGRKGQPFKFITLTLPAAQQRAAGESDREIKRKCLNTFTQRLRRRGIWYVWKAEPQKNGNIHFHLVIDQYYKKEDLQRDWNNILAGTTTQIDRFEAKHGHRNPPSTQIDQAKNNAQTAQYFIEYFRDHNKHEGRRKIQGKLWGMHNRLKHLAPFAVHAESAPDLYKFIIEEFKSVKPQNLILDDFYSWQSFKISDFPDTLRPLLRQFHQEQYRILKRDRVDWYQYALLHKRGIPNGYRLKAFDNLEKKDNGRYKTVDVDQFLAFQGISSIGGYKVKIPKLAPESSENEARNTVTSRLSRRSKSCQMADRAQQKFCL